LRKVTRFQPAAAAKLVDNPATAAKPAQAAKLTGADKRAAGGGS
jgi:hypothetical protein